MNENHMNLTTNQANELIAILQARFERNSSRHEGLNWLHIQKRLEITTEKLWSLYKMEETGGEPDVIGIDEISGEYVFFDCSIESPKGRRSLCYDREALESRKEYKPANCVLDMASQMGIELLSEKDYRYLQTLGTFDLKTSSWIKTPDSIRKLGGAVFCDRRYDTVFMYHNGAESYYAARGFRGLLKI